MSPSYDRYEARAEMCRLFGHQQPRLWESLHRLVCSWCGISWLINAAGRAGQK